MDKETQRLIDAFNTKQEIEGYLDNLEQLKAAGAITDTQYTNSKKDYHRRLGTAVSAISLMKNRFRENLAANRSKIKARSKDLGNLEVRHKVGELSEGEYLKSVQKLQAEIEKLGQKSDRLNLLIRADSAADAGGVPSGKRQAAAGDVQDSGELVTRVKVASQEKMAKTGIGKLPIIAGGAVVIVMVIIVAVVLLLSGGRDKAASPSVVVEGSNIEIPVDIRNAGDIGGLQFELIYDAGVLIPAGVTGGSQAGDAILEYSIDVPGRIIVGIISGRGISGDGPVAVIEFMIRGESKVTVLLDLENPVAYGAGDMTGVQVTSLDGTFEARDSSFEAPELVFGSGGGG